MGADIKSLRLRIRSVNSTLHLTKAMGLVASSKMRRAGEAMNKSHDYAQAVRKMTENLTSCPECQKSPYMKHRDTGRTKIIIVVGDRGLCGGYNANVLRLAAGYPEAEIIPIGKRASERYGSSVPSEYFTREDGYAMASKLCSEFAAGEYDRLGIISTRYISMLSQEAEINWILPLERSENGADAGIIFEPDETEVLNSAVPEYVAAIIMAGVREGFACEVAARRMAMDSAGKNAQEMIDNLQLEYNRARQGAITQEITEIIAGSGG